MNKLKKHIKTNKIHKHMSGQALHILKIRPVVFVKGTSQDMSKPFGGNVVRGHPQQTRGRTTQSPLSGGSPHFVCKLMGAFCNRGDNLLKAFINLLKTIKSN